MKSAITSVEDITGSDLGSHTASYDESTAILYALSVGASSDELDLVYERDLRPLPAFACSLGLWAVEAAGRLGAYDPAQSLHAAQQLTIHEPLLPAGEIPMQGRVTDVFDKGTAGLVRVEVTSTAFTTVYDIFLPGLGGWCGARGPTRNAGPLVEFDHVETVQTSRELAAMYRLTGDRHPVHIDPVVAAANGFERPILHGLCTLGIAARAIASRVPAHPSTLSDLSVRLSAPVLPGDTIEVASGMEDGDVHFEARVGDRVVLRDGHARFDGVR